MRNPVFHPWIRSRVTSRDQRLLNRSKAWLWVAVTQVATVFTIAGTRGAKVIREMLGENYNRVLTSDRWTAYTWIKRRQLCWARLRRDFQAMIDRENGDAQSWPSMLTVSCFKPKVKKINLYGAHRMPASVVRKVGFFSQSEPGGFSKLV